MAAFAILNIVTAKGFFVVVTTCAALRISRSKVHGGNQRSSYLVSARRTGFDVVTSRAVEPVTGVTKRRRLISSRPFGSSAAEFSRLMTRITRSNILLAALRVWVVALKTGVVRA